MKNKTELHRSSDGYFRLMAVFADEEVHGDKRVVVIVEEELISEGWKETKDTVSVLMGFADMQKLMSAADANWGGFMSDEQRMRDLDADNIMCRRVNAALREQIQGLFKERDLAEESKNHANKLCGERTEEWRAQKIENESLIARVSEDAYLGEYAEGCKDKLDEATSESDCYEKAYIKADRERITWKEAHKYLQRFVDGVKFETGELSDGLYLEAEAAYADAIRVELGKK